MLMFKHKVKGFTLKKKQKQKQQNNKAPNKNIRYKQLNSIHIHTCTHGMCFDFYSDDVALLLFLLLRIQFWFFPYG